MSIEKAFAFERGDVLHDRCLAGEAEMALDFAGAWCKPFFPLLALDKIENVFLTIGQHATMIADSDHRASSNEQMRIVCFYSDSEALAAGAMRDRIRVRNFETAFLQVVAVIEDRTADEECALRIDNQTDVGGLNQNVAVGGAVHEIHGILKTRASASNHSEA